MFDISNPINLVQFLWNISSIQRLKNETLNFETLFRIRVHLKNLIFLNSAPKKSPSSIWLSTTLIKLIWSISIKNESWAFRVQIGVEWKMWWGRGKQPKNRYFGTLFKFSEKSTFPSLSVKSGHSEPKSRWDGDSDDFLDLVTETPPFDNNSLDFWIKLIF